jgi:SAM-dependent methyltransferase
MSEPAVFSEYGRYYDLLYKDKDYAGEADYVHRLIQRFRPGARTVLELGSGTGKHAALLADRGYEVYGIERSEEMLARARALASDRKREALEWPTPSFSLGDIRTARVDRKFDVAISLFHVISYQVTNEDLLAAFTTARLHLNEGGLFLFDVWYGPAVLTDRPAVRVKRMADDQIEVTRLAEPAMRPNDNVVEVNYHVFIRNGVTGQVGETRETHVMRYLFQPEIVMLAEQAGFRFEHDEEWLTGKPIGFGTWGACFVCRAR